MDPPRQDEDPWYIEARELLEEAYLPVDDPHGQSRLRRHGSPLGASPATHRRGGRPQQTFFLDIGCANGLLMETLSEAEGADSNGVVFVSVAWIDAPHLTQ